MQLKVGVDVRHGMFASEQCRNRQRVKLYDPYMTMLGEHAHEAYELMQICLHQACGKNRGSKHNKHV